MQDLPLAIPYGTAEVPLDTEQARDFFQRRIALFAWVTFLLASGFWIVGNALGKLFHGHVPLSIIVLSAGNLWHLAGCGLSFLAWLIASRTALDQRVLPWFDGALVVSLMALYAAMGHAARLPGSRTDLIVLLIGMLVQMSRAVMVPSAPRQTAAIGALASVPPIVLAWHLAPDLPHRGASSVYLLSASYTALWCIATTATATFASRVIFGLRQQVKKAAQLGQYTLDEKLGEGGMGIVFKAHHALLRRATAVKLLPPSKAGAKNLLRFEREVQLTSRLTHPNTVAIYDYGRTPAGVFYYAMEYLEGLTLQQLVEIDGPQEPARVVHVLVQACGALGEAHAIGLVHRDIKPANIMLCERGGVPDTVKVVDFGLVKEIETQGAALTAELSGTNVVMGTPLYLSPEAITHPDLVDARSDLYALGAVAYFLLAGRPVFDSPSVVEVCAHHLHSLPAPPSEHTDRPIPIGLERLVLRCLDKSPATRPQSARELREALIALRIPEWTEGDATAWWKKIASDEKWRRRESSVASRTGGATLAVDLAHRATRGVSVKHEVA
jgi:eukaryotic-like serine/threonine-protein kinase